MRPGVPGRRAIVDRRAVADRLAGASRGAAAEILKQALADGRAEIARRLADKPYAGTEVAAAYAFLTDQILRLIFDFTVERLYPINNPSAAERLTLIAVLTLPITAVSSVYGMNIIVNDRTDFPHLTVVVAAMLVISAIVLRWAKRQEWW